MVTALGSHSPKLDKVRDLLTKRGRREQGRFAFEGPTLLHEALSSGFPLDAIYATEAAYLVLDASVKSAIACPVYLIGDRDMRRISQVESPQGIVCMAKMRLAEPDRLLADASTALLLGGLADPGNAGTLLRSAEAFGLDAVLFGEDGAEPYNPKVVRAAMGSLFRLRIATVRGSEIPELAARHGYAIVAADRSGVALETFPFPEKTMLAVGNERRGLSGWLPRWDAAVAIPHLGGTESLNAAVAGSIVLYELALRRSGLSRGLSTRQKP